MKLVWTEQALVRLREIHSFVALDSPDVAERLVETVIQRAWPLARFPRMGRRLPELPRINLREPIEDRYRIVYRVRRRRVEVITVFEAHRRLPVDELVP